MVKAGGKQRKYDLGLWEHVTQLNKKRVKCKHCGYEFAKNVTKIKYHINQIKGKGVRVCDSLAKSANNLVSINGVTSNLKENIPHSQGPHGAPTSPLKNNPSALPEVSQQLISSTLEIPIVQRSSAQPSSQRIKFVDSKSSWLELLASLKSLCHKDFRSFSDVECTELFSYAAILPVAFPHREDLKNLAATAKNCLKQRECLIRLIGELAAEECQLRHHKVGKHEMLVSIYEEKLSHTKKIFGAETKGEEEINDLKLMEKNLVEILEKVISEREIKKAHQVDLSTERAELIEQAKASVTEHEEFKKSWCAKASMYEVLVKEHEEADKKLSEMEQCWNHLRELDLSFVKEKYGKRED